MSDTKSHRAFWFSLLLFTVLTFGLSWTIWIFGLPVSNWYLVAGSFAPTVCGIVVTALFDGKAGLKQIMEKLFIWRVNPLWYVFSFGSTALVVGLALAWYRSIGGVVIQTNDPRQWYLAIPAFFQILFLSVLGEEIGWRGFALPRMQAKMGALLASVLLGLVWSLWHLPLFWHAGNFHSQLPISLFLLQSTALSILITWLYNASGSSLLLVHLFHTASNLTLGVLPILPQNTGGDLRPLWAAVGLLWVLTLSVVIGSRGKLGYKEKPWLK